MDSDFSTAGLAGVLRRFIDGDLPSDELRAYLSACDDAIQEGRAPAALSRPVGTAVLTIMEQEEGVRPPADVRSTLLSVYSGLTGEPTHRGRAPRNPIPRPKPRKVKNKRGRGR